MQNSRDIAVLQKYLFRQFIFTGTNNFVSDTITNSRLNEYFGFVQMEVDQLLKDADLVERAVDIKAWYDGYHFGD